MAKSRSPADPVRREYGRLASRYDKRWSFYNVATIQAALSRLHLAGTERVLDVGCGTGNLVVSLRERWPLLRCWGLDLCVEMLWVAKSKFAEGAAHPPLIQGRAEHLPFADGFFDVVISCNALHFVPSPLQALSEFRRVLRPGGQLLVTDWCDDYFSCRLCSFVLRALGREHGRLLGAGECAAFLRRTGFAGERIERFKINWLWGLMAASASVSRPGAS